MSTLPSRPSADDLCRTHLDDALLYARNLWYKDLSLKDRIDLVDAESAAGVGLHRAADSWDPKAGSPFEAWMRRVVWYEVQEEARQNNIIGRSAMRKVKELAEAEKFLEAGSGVAPTTAQVAHHLEISVHEVDRRQQLRNTAKEAAPFDTAVEPTRGTTQEEEPDSRVADALSAFGPLKDEERTILSLHYIAGVPFKHIADITGQRPDQVSRTHRRSLKELRSLFSPESDTVRAQ